MEKIKVTVEYFNGCPHAEEMLFKTKEAISGLEEQVEFQEVLVETDEKAMETGFRGSPTLLINDTDFEGLPRRENPYLNCRFYPNGLPSVDDIRNRIIEIMNSK